MRYQQSKLANLLFTYALHERRNDPAVKALAAHPGPMDSGLQAKPAAAGGTRLLDRFILGRALRGAHWVEDGTCGIARARCEAKVDSAAFYGPAGRGKAGEAVLLPPERDQPAEALLWRASLEATGVTDFFG